MWFSFPIGGLAALILGLVLGGGLLLYAIGSLGEAVAGPEGQIDHATSGLQNLAGPFDPSEVFVVADLDLKLIGNWTAVSGYALGFRSSRTDILSFLFFRSERDGHPAGSNISLVDGSMILKTRLSVFLSNAETEFFEINRSQLDSILENNGVFFRNGTETRVHQSENDQRIRTAAILERIT